MSVLYTIRFCDNGPHVERKLDFWPKIYGQIFNPGVITIPIR